MIDVIGFAEQFHIGEDQCLEERGRERDFLLESLVVVLLHPRLDRASSESLRSVDFDWWIQFGHTDLIEISQKRKIRRISLTYPRNCRNPSRADAELDRYKLEVRRNTLLNVSRECMISSIGWRRRRFTFETEKHSRGAEFDFDVFVVLRGWIGRRCLRGLHSKDDVRVDQRLLCCLSKKKIFIGVASIGNHLSMPTSSTCQVHASFIGMVSHVEHRSVFPSTRLHFGVHISSLDRKWRENEAFSSLLCGQTTMMDRLEELEDETNVGVDSDEIVSPSDTNSSTFDWHSTRNLKRNREILAISSWRLPCSSTARFVSIVQSSSHCQPAGGMTRSSLLSTLSPVYSQKDRLSFARERENSSVRNLSTRPSSVAIGRRQSVDVDARRLLRWISDVQHHPHIEH